MSDERALTPRIFIFRHGETEWSKSGRMTSTTELRLTQAGETQVTSAAALIVGNGKLIDPRRLARVFVSPRQRAKKTMDLLLPPSLDIDKEKFIVTDDLKEWDYGRYEGLKKDEVSRLRRSKSSNEEGQWDVWTHGCDGGESVQQVTDRLDKFISEIKDIHEVYIHRAEPGDIVLVAHGLILRCLVKRWIGFGISDNLPMEFDTGGVGILSYKNNNINEPSIHIAVSLPSGD